MATELAKAYVQIIPSAKGIQGKIQQELGGAQVGQKAGAAIGGGLVGKLTGLIAAAGIGTMIVKGITDAVKAGGALQQSIGGVETLFKDSADTVIKNAERAYKTAGMSANSYMENVTGFSASLLQSLGGDTDAAAKVADRAMRDMSDNANKFGTDMSSITYAYQGFAKDNYTMLDNLKLGYGGTKTEMQRLIKDAASMKDIQEKLGVTVDENSMSFANVANAISVVQESLGITGTTAKEAEKTLSGSFAAMQGAFDNFKAHLALGEDISEDLQAIADTVSTFVFDNLLPMIGNIVSQLPGAIKEFITEHADEFAERGKDILIAIGQGFIRSVLDLGNLFNQGMENFKEAMNEWEPGENLEVAQNIIDAIGEGLANIVPALMARFEEGLDNLIEAINAYDPVEAGIAGNNIIDAIGRGIEEHGPTILGAIGRVIGKALLAMILAGPKFAVTAGMWIWHIIMGLQQKSFELFLELGEIVRQAIFKLSEKMGEFLKVGAEWIKNLILGILSIIPNLLVTIGQLLQQALQQSGSKSGEWKNKGVEWIKNIILGILSMAGNLLSTIGSLLLQALGVIGGKNGDFRNKGSGMITSVSGGASSAGGGLNSTMSGLGSGALSAFRSAASDTYSIGSNIVSGIQRGISGASGGLFSSLRSLASQALSSAKSALGISSPSKVFAKEVGQWIPAGIVEGIENNQSIVDQAMSDLNKMTSSSFDSEFAVTANGGNSPELTAVLSLLNGIYGLLQEGQTITIGKRDFARLMYEVS